MDELINQKIIYLKKFKNTLYSSTFSPEIQNIYREVKDFLNSNKFHQEFNGHIDENIIRHKFGNTDLDSLKKFVNELEIEITRLLKLNNELNKPSN